LLSKGVAQNLALLMKSCIKRVLDTFIMTHKKRPG
jgi:hypothetical protein